VPVARSPLAPVLLQHAHAAMDISDGFVGDLRKMLALPSLGADIHLQDVPLSVAARAAIKLHPGMFETALTGGDDYEILAAVSPAMSTSFEQASLKAGLRVSKVGYVTQLGEPVRFKQCDGTERLFSKGSYEH
jgi:thiamine-monophosphate kinase